MHSDRHNNCVNQTVLHGVITSFVDVEEYKKKSPLQLYEDVFESQFLKETGDYYRSEAAKLKDECSCSDYMEKVKKNLKITLIRTIDKLGWNSFNLYHAECPK